MIDIHNYTRSQRPNDIIYICMIYCSIMYFVTGSPKNDEKNCRMSKTCLQVGIVHGNRIEKCPF